MIPMNINECTKIVEQYLAPKLLERIGIKKNEARMKLVTGVEAIQSDKPIRKHHQGKPIGEWFRPEFGDRFTFTELTTPCFEIEQDPREFWVNPSKGTMVSEVGEVKMSDFSKREGWIKVREVLE